MRKEKLTLEENRKTCFSRRQFLGLVGAAGAAIPLARFAFSAQEPEENRPPNFIIIFADDLGYDDLGCFWTPNDKSDYEKIETPNLDKMAEEGIKFTDFYVGASVCTPSRAALMTGCYPVRVGLAGPQLVLSPDSKIGLNPDEITIAEILRSRGYATSCVGKWHLGHLKPFLPTRHGFDEYYGIPYSNDMEPSILMRNEDVIEQPVIQETLTERYTEESIKFIEKNKDKPFFLYLAHTMPHTPLHISEKFKGKSKRGIYGDVIQCLDWSAGQILAALKKQGIDNKTLIVFTSDNGPWLLRGKHGGKAYPLRSGKCTTFEGGMRVPCIIRWPNHIPKGRVCSETATTMDMLPTFAKLAGGQVPSDRIIDGKDIWPLMAGFAGAKTPHDAFYYYLKDMLQAVRSENWKLMVERTTKEEYPYEWPGMMKKGAKDEAVPEALYNLKSDIGETKNVINENPKVAERLRGLLEKMRDDLGDWRTGRSGKNRRSPGNIDSVGK